MDQRTPAPARSKEPEPPCGCPPCTTCTPACVEHAAGCPARPQGPSAKERVLGVEARMARIEEALAELLPRIRALVAQAERLKELDEAAR